MRHQWQLPWAGSVNNAQSQSHTSCSPVNTQANPFPRALICSYLTNSLISTKSSAITLGKSAYLYPDPTSDGGGGGGGASKEKDMDPSHFQSWRHNYLSPHLTFNLLRSVNLPGYLGLLIKARNNSSPHSKLAITIPPPQKKTKKQNTHNKRLFPFTLPALTLDDRVSAEPCITAWESQDRHLSSPLSKNEATKLEIGPNHGQRESSEKKG